ncbi:MAG: hypothetical protein JWR83_691 [Aeromicrobium sp.]|nr:hypothetical protein [Aeromicrobium sp.]
MFRRPVTSKASAREVAGDPLAPVEFITTVLLAFAIGLALLFAAVAGVQVVTSGHTSISVAEIGSGDTCVTVPFSNANMGTYNAFGNGNKRTEGITHFRNTVADYRADSWRICLKQPTLVEYWAARIDPVGRFVFTLGALLLIRRFIRTARQRGLFTQPTATATRHLGWFLLLFSTLAPFAAVAGSGLIVSEAVKGAHWYNGLWSPDLSLVLIVTALGVLTMARVLGRAVHLQEEVDATV